MKHNFKSNRKAFTLVELLIVIAIIGILFVVLVSKVDFATDKASTTGVQTDFRSFQVAFETVSRENSGFATLGWDTGDNAGGIAKDGPVTINGIDYTYANAEKDAGDRKRNSYDVGDLNLNGKCDVDETFTGRKIYTETWTSIYTLDNPGDADDKSAYIDLENAINKNLDPKLHITINPENKTIYMANGYQDPWKTEYHGFYLSNAANDGMDRGAIVMYSDGPNKVFGSEQTISNGIVQITVIGNNIKGQDDLSVITCYTYTNGYGEVGTTTTGFSNNQSSSGGDNKVSTEATSVEYEMLDEVLEPITNASSSITIRSEAPYSEFKELKVNGAVVDSEYYSVTEGSTVIRIYATYLITLSNGSHNVEIVSNNGSAKTVITMNLNTTPCDSHTNPATWEGFWVKGKCAICRYECEHPEEYLAYHYRDKVDCETCRVSQICNICGDVLYLTPQAHIPSDDDQNMCWGCYSYIHVFENNICIDCGYTPDNDTDTGCPHNTIDTEYYIYNNCTDCQKCTLCWDCFTILDGTIIPHVPSVEDPNKCVNCYETNATLIHRYDTDTGICMDCGITNPLHNM